jgi:hypothetical protein
MADSGGALTISLVPLLIVGGLPHRHLERQSQRRRQRQRLNSATGATLGLAPIVHRKPELPNAGDVAIEPPTDS